MLDTFASYDATHSALRYKEVSYVELWNPIRNSITIQFNFNFSILVDPHSFTSKYSLIVLILYRRVTTVKKKYMK